MRYRRDARRAARPVTKKYATTGTIKYAHARRPKMR
jgi:hypothetical protein